MVLLHEELAHRPADAVALRVVDAEACDQFAGFIGDDVLRHGLELHDLRHLRDRRHHR